MNNRNSTVTLALHQSETSECLLVMLNKDCLFLISMDNAIQTHISQNVTRNELCINEEEKKLWKGGGKRKRK